MKYTFEGQGDFDALNKAEEWLKNQGYSLGSLQGPSPVGIMKGDFCISKWRNLSEKEKNELGGVLTGPSKRSGPVTVEIYEAPK
jgi:hypothetical protein